MLLQSEYLTIFQLPEIQGIAIQWHESSEKMSTDDFRGAIIAEKDAIDTVKPRAVFADTLNMRYTITPELQEWHNTIIFPAFEAAGTQKLGILVSQDLFAQISIEQLIDDSSVEGLQTKYFSSKESALEWLKN
jgi:hypothetical protein